MLINRKLCVLVLATIAAPTAFPASSQTIGQPVRKVGQKPEPGVESVVTVGSVLLERYDLTERAMPRLEAELSLSLGIQGKIVAPAGSLLTVERANPLKACTTSGGYVDHLVGPRGAACLMDNDMDGAFDKASAADVLFTTKKINPPARYTLVSVTTPEAGNSFRQALIYLGTSAGTLRLSYREFSNDMARPAFTEELSFPMEATFPQTVAWRDTRITLLGVSNAGLRYRVEGKQ
jgi:hypothetical protein